MLDIFTSGEQEICDEPILSVSMSANDDPAGPEDMMESIIDKLLGMSKFLEDNAQLYSMIEASFSIPLPKGHDAMSYVNIPEILDNMEHKKLVEWYKEHLADSFEDASVDEDMVYLYFVVSPSEHLVEVDEIYNYYHEHVIMETT